MTPPAGPQRPPGDDRSGMKRIAAILVVLAVLAGCEWFQRRQRDEVIKPDQEVATTWPAATWPATARAPGPPDTAPATTATATTSATAPAGAAATAAARGYTITGAPTVVAAGILQVNRKFITLRDVLHPIRRALRTAAGSGSEARFRRDALALIRQEQIRQIQQVLLLAAAKDRFEDRHTEAIKEEVRKRLRQAVAEFGGSRTRFDERLREEGTDLAAWLVDMERSLTVQTYLRLHFESRIAVNQRMKRKYYADHRDEFRAAERVQMQVIAAPLSAFLPEGGWPSQAERDAAKVKAKVVIARADAAVKAGKDFADVAREHSKGPMASKGGVWEPMERGSFRAKEVEQAAFAQKVGQVSKVVEAADGFYIVKTLARQAGRERSFEDVQGQIEAQLRRRQYRQLTEAFRRKLYSKATVAGTERFERAAVDAAVRMYLKK